jgi:hypothetical protein
MYEFRGCFEIHFRECGNNGKQLFKDRTLMKDDKYRFKLRLME